METNKRGLRTFLAVISMLISFGLGGYCLYLSYLHNYWFILIGIYFLFEGLFIFISSLIKDEYKAMRVQGVFQILGVILMMDYLLVMILWNDAPDYYMGTVYNLSYIVFGACAGVKGLLSLVSTIAIKKEYHPSIHAYRNNDLITFFYLLLIIELVVFNQFFTGHGEGLLKDKDLWVYIIIVASNAILTIFAALLALGTDIRSKTKEDVTTVGKIKRTVTWFNEKEISMYFGLIFTGYLAFLAFVNVKQSWIYIFLGIYYVGMGLIRFINYLWHLRIMKKCEGNKIRENRLSSWILFFDAFAYALFSDLICFAAVMIMTNKASVDTNIYLFLFMIIPFGIIRFVSAVKGIKSNRRENNTYKLGVSYISLLGAVFALLEITAILCHPIQVVVRTILIILMVSVVKIFVLVIAVIFIVHWIRSMIINRRGKERKLDKKNK